MPTTLAPTDTSVRRTQARFQRRFLRHFVALSDFDLAGLDPVEMNLLVAQGVPALADLNIRRYQGIANQWAEDICRRLTGAEKEFHKTPHQWKNDIHFFRLGVVCWYVDEVLGIRYREDQRDLAQVLYTDPSDLFLNGVMDSRCGTCANMAALHVALCWRLGWPASLACVGPHLICRYDDGQVTHNIEATNNGKGGFHSHPDDYYLEQHRLSRKAVTSGSDLRAVTPREMLGLFVGARARYLENTGRPEKAEADYLLARYLFPCNRQLYIRQTRASVQQSCNRFDSGEPGHPKGLAGWLDGTAYFDAPVDGRTPEDSPGCFRIDPLIPSRQDRRVP
jgi:hypothetical protein